MITTKLRRAPLSVRLSAATPDQVVLELDHREEQKVAVGPHPPRMAVRSSHMPDRHAKGTNVRWKWGDSYASGKVSLSRAPR